MSWAEFRQGISTRLEMLAQDLHDGTWFPGPLRQVRLSAYTGKRFMVVIPTTRDRIVHRALRDAMTPILEEHAFTDFVSGWSRPGRNRLTAVRQAAVHISAGLDWVADIDVEKVSAGSTVDQLIDALARWIHDGTFLSRVRTALAALPDPLAAGSGLTPTLINVRLSPVDMALADLPVVRFADNYTAFAHDALSASDAFDRIVVALADVGLRYAPGKSAVHRRHAEDLFLIAG